LTVLKAFKAIRACYSPAHWPTTSFFPIIPLLTFLLLMLSHVVNEDALLATLSRYLGLVIPGASEVVLAQVRGFLQHREVASWFVLASMLFFSSLAFTVLENAMSIIFVHRVKKKHETSTRFAASSLPLHSSTRSRLSHYDGDC
jgi:hypothetical protein